MPVSIEVPASTVRCVRVRHEPQEVSSVRRALHDDLLRDPRTSQVADDVAVVTSELVGNAVRHAGTDVVLTVRCDDHLVVTVHDGADPIAAEVPDTAAPGAASGRGLQIVSVISDEWGVVPDDQGKSVWFSLTLPDEAGGDAELVQLRDPRGPRSRPDAPARRAERREEQARASR